MYSIWSLGPLGQHLPIDHFLRSLAIDQAGKAIGVILSGTASDGALGLKAIKAEGGITIAQDIASARYDGMPRSAVATGCVDYVLAPDQIARELVRLSPSDEHAFDGVFSMLRAATGVDVHLLQAWHDPAAHSSAHGAAQNR